LHDDFPNAILNAKAEDNCYSNADSRNWNERAIYCTYSMGIIGNILHSIIKDGMAFSKDTMEPMEFTLPMKLTLELMSWGLGAFLHL
jgi:hypothetical protein